MRDPSLRMGRGARTNEYSRAHDPANERRASEFFLLGLAGKAHTSDNILIIGAIPAFTLDLRLPQVKIVWQFGIALSKVLQHSITPDSVN